MEDKGFGERVATGGGSGRSGRSQDLEEELTIVQFSKIMDKLEEVGQQDSPYQRSPQVSTEEFRSILSEVFGKSPEDRKVKALCDKVRIFLILPKKLHYPFRNKKKTHKIDCCCTTSRLMQKGLDLCELKNSALTSSRN